MTEVDPKTKKDLLSTAGDVTFKSVAGILSISLVVFGMLRNDHIFAAMGVILNIFLLGIQFDVSFLGLNAKSKGK